MTKNFTITISDNGDTIRIHGTFDGVTKGYVIKTLRMALYNIAKDKKGEYTSGYAEFKLKKIKNEDTISDGFDNTIVNRCLRCGGKSMQVVRPGDFKCKYCD